MNGERVARSIVDAIRLDQWDDGQVERRVTRALEVGVGGFVLFGGDVERVSRLTARIRSAAGRDLWIAADLERGAGQQFRGLTEFPPPAALANHPAPLQAAARAAAVTAREAMSVGVNWVLAPVLDLDTERENPIVATRSFGADVDTVSTLGLEWILACQAEGALACGKHFPGHGRTLTDSHIELPIVRAGPEDLGLDLAPFRAVADLAGSMMAGHVAYPAYGSERAATVSREIVTTLLRETIGFEGLLATDAMIMAGIGEDDADAAVDAIAAGCDVVLYPSDVARTARALARAADADPSMADRVEQAVARSDRWLSRFPSAPSGAVPEQSSTAFARETIVDAGSGLTEWSAAEPTEIVAIADDPQIGPPAGREGPLGDIFARELEAAGWGVTLRNVDPDGGSNASPQTRQRVIVLAATPRGWKGHGGPSPAVTTRIRAELASSERGVVVLLGHRRWLEDLGVPGICAWSTETVMERAAAAWVDNRVRAGSNA